MKINEFIIENFQTVSINGILRSLNNDEKKIYTKVKENGKLLKSELDEYDQRIASDMVTKGLLCRRKNPQHEIYFTAKGRRKCALSKPIDEVAPPDSQIEKWIEDNKQRFQDRYGKQYKKYLYGKAWNKFNGKKINESYDRAREEFLKRNHLPDLPNGNINDLPEHLKMECDELASIGDEFKKIGKNDRYLVSDIKRTYFSFNNKLYSQPVYQLTNIATHQVLDDIYNTPLLINYIKVKEDYWDGEDDEELNETYYHHVPQFNIGDQFKTKTGIIVTITDSHEYDSEDGCPLYRIKTDKGNYFDDEWIRESAFFKWEKISDNEWDGEDDEDEELLESMQKSLFSKGQQLIHIESGEIATIKNIEYKSGLGFFYEIEFIKYFGDSSTPSHVRYIEPEKHLIDNYKDINEDYWDGDDEE